MSRRAILLITAVACYTTISAQFKIGVFDTDLMVQIMLGYNTKIDSVLQAYNKDSLEVEFEFLQKEYLRVDSSFRADSVAGKSKTILEFKQRQRNELAINLINWERIAEYRIQQKRQYFARPFYEKVNAAFKKVVAEKKYDLVLKPNTYEFGSDLDNVFVHVAKELNIQLPNELSGKP